MSSVCYVEEIHRSAYCFYPSLKPVICLGDLFISLFSFMRTRPCSLTQKLSACNFSPRKLDV